jgi:hypothetical protein
MLSGTYPCNTRDYKFSTVDYKMLCSEKAGEFRLDGCDSWRKLIPNHSVFRHLCDVASQNPAS